MHLAATITTGGRGLSFQHRVEEGPSDMEAGYGIALASHCGFPECVLQEAECVKRLLDRKGRGGGAGAADDEEEEVVEGAIPAWQYAVLQRLMMLKGCLDPDSTNPKTPAEVHTFLARLRATLVPGDVEQGQEEQEGSAMIEVDAGTNGDGGGGESVEMDG